MEKLVILLLMKTDQQLLQEVRDKEQAARQVLAQLAAARREIMIRLWDNGNGLTYQQIADIYGVKHRQRVEWIVSGKKQPQSRP